jgi:hypothetical protein
MIEAHFKNIRNLIIDNIRASKTEIKIAVAWFTQRQLYDAVLDALERGVKVSLIMMKDFINCGIYGLPLQSFVDKGGLLHFVTSRGWTMHNKFCLFDNSMVISGSYNWTYSAETRNAENVIATDDNDVCSRFDDYFNRLWEESFAEETIPSVEISPEEVIQDFSFILDELEAMEGKEIIPSGTLNILKTTKTAVDVAVAKTAKPVLPLLRPAEYATKKEKIVETSILEPICCNGNPIKPGESVLLKTISMPFSSGREWVFGKQGDTLPTKYSKCGLCNAADLVEENEGNVICCNLKKYIDENIDGDIFETYLKETELLRFDNLPRVPKNKCRFLGRANISKSGLLTFSVYCYNTKETKKAEIQLVEGEDFIIGK